MKTVHWAFRMDIPSSRGDQIVDFEGTVSVPDGSNIEQAVIGEVLKRGKLSWGEFKNPEAA